MLPSPEMLSSPSLLQIPSLLPSAQDPLPAAPKPPQSLLLLGGGESNRTNRIPMPVIETASHHNTRLWWEDFFWFRGCRRGRGSVA